MSKAAKHVEAGEDGLPANTQDAHNEIVVDALTKLTDKVASMSPPVAKAVVHGDGKKDRVNIHGDTLMARFTLAKKTGAPDPLCITINDEFFWMKRGIEVIVPFYLVFHMRNNIETRYLQEKNEQGKNIVVTEQVPAESFQYVWIDPAAGQSDL